MKVGIPDASQRRPELVAPAGSPEALRAAAEAGADAVYLGLRALSARAFARNFTLLELSRAVEEAAAAGTHVYVTMNTLLRPEELETAGRLLAGIERAGADAVIVQDLGLFELVQRAAPNLRVHASTQLAVHSAEGLRRLVDVGVERAVVARELSLDDIARLRAAVPGCELEVFVHGALCWGASGLCLMSSLATGRSGNRGRCGQPCRRPLQTADGDNGLVFSLQDLWGLDYVDELARLGVAAFKLEGRLHSAGYVAAAVRTYRAAIDGGVEALDGVASGTRAVRTQFSRRPSGGFLGGPEASDRAVVDPVFQGHRGFPVGTVVRRLVTEEQGGDRLVLTTSGAFAVGDRLLLDRGDPRPYNLEVRDLRRGDEPIEAAGAGETVSIPAPPAEFPPGAGVYLVTAQDVKRACVAPEGQWPPLPPIPVTVDIAPERVTIEAPLPDGGRHQLVSRDLHDRRVAPIADADLRRVLEEEEAGSHLSVASVDWKVETLRVAPKVVRRVRRDFVRGYTLAADIAGTGLRPAARELLTAHASAPDAQPRERRPGLGRQGEQWTVRVDDTRPLSAALLARVYRVQLLLDPSAPEAALAVQARAREAGVTFELALPPLITDRELPAYAAVVERLVAAGARDFQVANLGGLALVPRDANVSLDHTVYVANPLALAWARRALGATRVTTPLEADRDLLRSLAPTLADHADVLVFGDIVAMWGAAPPRTAARELGDQTIVDAHARSFRLRRDHADRTRVIPDAPFSLTAHVGDLRELGYRAYRMDFVERTYGSAAANEILAAAQASQALPGTEEGNWSRGWA